MKKAQNVVQKILSKHLVEGNPATDSEIGIHIDQTLKGERGTDSVQDIANFYGKYGVDPKTFADTMGSFGIAAKVNRGKQFAQRSKIAGTPSLIVNGKYLVKGKGYEDMLRIADHLIARERAANAK